MRTPKGRVHKAKNGKIYARFEFTDPSTGKKHYLNRLATSRSDARDLLDKFRREWQEQEGRTLQHEKKKFSDLADFFERSYVTEAVYVGDRKVQGYRSLASVSSRMKVLRAFFDDRPLRALTYESVRRFRLKRLSTPTRNGAPRAIASVNRELELLRRMLNVAQREGWIVRNPFHAGDTLISHADERQRERILSREEEQRLLAACPERSSVGALIVCALDTGMRLGEILKLTWNDVDLDAGVIEIRAMNTKTLRRRQVEVTDRLRGVLVSLASKGDGEATGCLVFGVRDNVRRAFNHAREAACLRDVRFHDLRHTAATRLVQGKLPLPEVGRILGHVQPSTTYRYVNADAGTRQRAAAILNQFGDGGNVGGSAAPGGIAEPSSDTVG